MMLKAKYMVHIDTYRASVHRHPYFDLLWIYCTLLVEAPGFNSQVTAIATLLPLFHRCHSGAPQCCHLRQRDIRRAAVSGAGRRRAIGGGSKNEFLRTMGAGKTMRKSGENEGKP